MKSLSYAVILLLLPVCRIAAQHNFVTEKGTISFFSEAPVADVDARNDNVRIELNTSTQELTFDVSMAEFQFKNKKMGRDADKKYLEREKYPKAEFKGNITTKLDYNKPGKHTVGVTGVLKIHGTEKKITEKGTVTVQKNKIILQSSFNVLLKDYNIETPTILGKEMTADKVLVRVEASLAVQTDLAKKK